MKIQQGISYVGVSDVWGGKMWFCIKSEGCTESVWFWTKNECMQYVRQHFTGASKQALLDMLDDCHAHAVMYA